MKNIKRILMILFVTIATVLCFTPKLKRVSAETLKTVTVHYYRYDNKYSHFGWFWTATTKGQAQMMETTSPYGRKAVFTIPDGCDEEKFGLLFCQTTLGPGAWGGEQTSDFYFYKTDLEVDSKGNANVYYIQAEEYPCYTEADAKEAMKDKFIYLSFDSAKTITYTPSSGKVANLKLYEDGNQIEAKDNGTNRITLSKNLDFTKTYTVDCTVNNQPVKQQVSFQSLYQSSTWNDEFGYDGNDLGATYSSGGTTFKLWAPISKEVTVNLFEYGHPTEFGTSEYPGDDTPYATYPMEKGEKGVWSVTVPEDLDGVYYTYTVKNSEITINEIVDPYAKSAGLNGLRGMVVNFSDDNDKLNPAKWAEAKRPEARSNVDSVIYETHVRDLTAHSSWGGNKKYSGTFLGLAQSGTRYSSGGITVSTGLDHIVEMGVTDVHLLPIMDSDYVDETRLNDPEYKALEEDGIYNWGYMTSLFFTLDGGYSTNPYDGYARMKEFKELVLAFNENDINVVMDVVFNHSGVASVSNFHKIIPYYFHRSNKGALTNGSGCGNELASENYMVRKLMVDSCTYFADEFRVGGFRFDLMGLEDTNAMNAVYESVSKVDPSTILYGEPWAAGTSTNTYTPANKANMGKMPNVAAFNDVARDGVRGENGQGSWSGWQFGAFDNSQFDKMVYGIYGGQKVTNINDNVWTDFTFKTPGQVINYASCHDNYSLYDQIVIKGASVLRSKEARMNATIQAISIMLTSQGVPFIEAGSEFGRTKGKYPSDYSIVADRNKVVHNSYNLGDKYNQIDWQWKVDNLQYSRSIRDLIAIRKNHEAFRQTTFTDVKTVMSKNTSLWDKNSNGNIIGYRLTDSNDKWSDMMIIHANAKATNLSYALPSAANAEGWTVVYSSSGEHEYGSTYKGSIKVGQCETIILVGNSDFVLEDRPHEEEMLTNPLVELFDEYKSYGLDKMYNYDKATQQEIIAVTKTFLNASYNSIEELNDAYETLRTSVDKILAGK